VELTRPHEEPIFPSMKGYEEAFDRGEGGTLGPTRLREMIVKRNALQKAYLDRWTATKTDGKGVMDGIILAASPWTAPRLGLSQTVFNVSYTGVFNLLGMDLMSPICKSKLADLKQITQSARFR
jgi:amidase